MEESKKNGENILLSDGSIEIINSGISLSEKEAEVGSEEKNRIEPDVTIDNKEIPEVKAEEQSQVEIPNAPEIPVAPEVSPVVPTPEPEIPVSAIPADVEPSTESPSLSSLDMGMFSNTPTDSETTVPNDSYNQNYDAPSVLDEDVKRIIQLAEVLGERIDAVKKENAALKSQEDSNRAEVARLNAEIENYKNEISQLQNSLTVAESKILDMFGLNHNSNGGGISRAA